MEIGVARMTEKRFTQFKIDLIVWKCKMSWGGVEPPSWFKIDLIVWKYGVDEVKLYV